MIDIKKLSPTAAKEIEELMGSELVYLIAFDAKNNLTHITPSSVDTEVHTLPDSPIKDVTSINHITYGTAASGCCKWMYSGGQWICVKYGC